MPKKLPSYGECQYSVFISYAFADSKANNAWVRALEEAIRKRLENLRKELTQLAPFLAERDGPAAGILSEELESAIARSFAMVLVVGDKYQASGWCERELQLFVDRFGKGGLRKRLFIVAMSEPALKGARHGKSWQENLAGDEQVSIPMYRGDEPKRPLVAKITATEFASDFWDQAVKLVDPLIAEIEADYDQTLKSPDTSDSDLGVHTPWSRTQHEQLRVAIGPATTLLKERTALLVGAMQSAGAQVTMLEHSSINYYIPETGYPLRQELENFDVLVAPVSNEWPLRSDRDGGHAVILRDEWDRAKKGPGIIWYRPGDLTVPAESTAAERHLAILAKLSPVCTSEQAVLNLLFGVKAGEALRVYIEKHPQGAASFYYVAGELEKAWEDLSRHERRPRLRCDLLEMSKLDSADKNVAGIVLLYPMGVKSPDSLAAQQKRIMDSFPRLGATYPGCVAVIFTPPPEELPLHDWPTVSFGKVEPDRKLVIEPNSIEWLAEFLNHIWKRYQVEVRH